MLNSIVRGKQQPVKAAEDGFVAKNGQFLKRFRSKLSRPAPLYENDWRGRPGACAAVRRAAAEKPLRAEGRRKHAGSAKPFADLEVSVISPNCEVERSG
jgi:hypothetical protein